MGPQLQLNTALTSFYSVKLRNASNVLETSFQMFSNVFKCRTLKNIVFKYNFSGPRQIWKVDTLQNGYTDCYIITGDTKVALEMCTAKTSLRRYADGCQASKVLPIIEIVRG